VFPALTVRADFDAVFFLEEDCLMSHHLSDPCPTAGDPTDPNGLTALLDRHLLWMETHHYAWGTVTLRRQTLTRFIRWCHERTVTRPGEVTRELLERYQRHLFFYRKRDGQRLGISSQSHALTALRRWFTWLSRERLIAQNPAAELQLPRAERRLPRHALSEDNVEAVLAQPDLATPLGLRDRAMLETLYSSGLRRGELLALYRHDVDRERGVVLIRRGKGNKDRVVPIGQRALAWIDKYVADVRPQLMPARATPVLFLTTSGRAMHPNQFSARVREYLQRAGVIQAGACHLFRHTTATLMLEAGADVRFIQALLGHESLKTTQIYTHVSIPQLRRVHAQTHPAWRLYRRADGPSSEASPRPSEPDDDREADGQPPA
jgi:integrase/recombinase XerD